VFEIFTSILSNQIDSSNRLFEIMLGGYSSNTKVK